MASWVPDSQLAQGTVEFRREERRHQDERLFTPTGQPTLSHAETRLLREADRTLLNLDIARDLMVDGVADDDPERCARAARSLLAIGSLLTAAADKAGV